MTARNATAFEDTSATVEQPARPGVYRFMLNDDDQRMGIQHGCPCGCGRWSAMWFKGMADAGGPEWEVTGEWPKVTLTPSIGIGRGEGPNNGYHWHGYLENGVFVER